MSYIGRTPSTGRYAKLDDISGSFNGSTTTFSLSIGSDTPNIASTAQVIISVGGVIQEPEKDFVIRISQIVFTTAPPSGASFFGVLLGETFNAAVPSTKSITGTHIQTGGINSNTLFGTGVITRHAIANGAISANVIIGTGAVTADLIATGAVGPTELATGAVSANTKIGNKIITQDNIAAGNVVTSLINDGAVTDSKIAVGTISADKLASGFINANTDFASGIITQHAIATGNVVTSTINDGAVTGAKLATGAVSANTKMAADVVGARELRIGNVAAANGVFTHNSHTFQKAQLGRVESVTVGAANVTLNFANANIFNLTLGINTHLNMPSNLTAGQGGSIIVTQDGSGSRTLSYASVWEFPGGTAPTLTTTASAQDRIDYFVVSANAVHAVASLNVT
jgi:hypothetical protein